MTGIFFLYLTKEITKFICTENAITSIITWYYNFSTTKNKVMKQKSVCRMVESFSTSLCNKKTMKKVCILGRRTEPFFPFLQLKAMRQKVCVEGRMTEYFLDHFAMKKS